MTILLTPDQSADLLAVIIYYAIIMFDMNIAFSKKGKKDDVPTDTPTQ